MSKLDDILIEAETDWSLDGQSSFEEAKEAQARCKQQIKDLMLELIGSYSERDTPEIQDYIDQLREKVQDL